MTSSASAGMRARRTVATVVPYTPAWPYYLAGAVICYSAGLFCLFLPTRPAADGAELTAGRPPISDRLGMLSRRIREMIATAKHELSGLPTLNRTLLAAAWVYGTYIAVEAVVPIIIRSNFPPNAARTRTERLLVLAIIVGCQFVPATLGALSILWSGTVTTLDRLRRATFGFGLICTLLAGTWLFKGARLSTGSPGWPSSSPGSAKPGSHRSTTPTTAASPAKRGVRATFCSQLASGGTPWPPWPHCS